LQESSIKFQQRDSLQEGDASVDVEDAAIGSKTDERKGKKIKRADRVKGVIQWFQWSKAQIDGLVFLKIVPGQNDIKADKVEDGVSGKATVVRRSRGQRGAKTIADAVGHILLDLQVGRVRVLEGVESHNMYCYKSPSILQSELEYFKARDAPEKVLALAQAAVHDAPEWTPLKYVPPLDKARRDAVINKSLEKCEEARQVIIVVIDDSDDDNNNNNNDDDDDVDDDVDDDDDDDDGDGRHLIISFKGWETMSKARSSTTKTIRRSWII